MVDLEARLSDAAVQMFDKQVGELFASARAAQKRRNVASARDVGRFMRLFDATLDALSAAKDDGADAPAGPRRGRSGGSGCRKSGRRSEPWPRPSMRIRSSARRPGT